jgi:hypothetical protein
MKTMIDLTDRFPMKFDVERMKADLAKLDSEKWLDHYDKGLAYGWTAIPLVTHDGSMDDSESQRISKDGQYKRTQVVEKMPYFRSILDAFDCPHQRIRILKMLPGTVIKPHRDIRAEVASLAFNKVRLHIPIITNEKVTFIVGGEKLKLSPGRLYYADFSKVHSVRNDGDAPRLHLVLDLEVNDFLRKVFPDRTLFDRAEQFVVRTTLPRWWQLLNARRVLANVFWENYDQSALQRLLQRFRRTQSGKPTVNR